MKILTVLTYYRPHTSGLTIYAERLARACFVCMEGAGHNPMWDRPQRFNELVLNFLADDD